MGRRPWANARNARTKRFKWPHIALCEGRWRTQSRHEDKMIDGCQVYNQERSANLVKEAWDSECMINLLWPTRHLDTLVFLIDICIHLPFITLKQAANVAYFENMLTRLLYAYYMFSNLGITSKRVFFQSLSRWVDRWPSVTFSDLWASGSLENRQAILDCSYDSHIHLWNCLTYFITVFFKGFFFSGIAWHICSHD